MIGTTVGLLAVLTTPLDGQSDRPAASVGGEEQTTRALAYLGWGAAGGAALGGLAGGILSAGLCDAADCSGSFREGLLWGALGGAVYAGVTGLVTGSAFRDRGPPAPRDVDWTAAAGGGWAGAGTLRGGRVTAGVAGARPTTDRVSFGFEVRYLGRSVHERLTEVWNPESPVRDLHRTVGLVFSAGILARRDLEGGPGGPFLLAGSGVYPVLESVEVRRLEGPDAGAGPTRYGSFAPLPGVGLGAGWEWEGSSSARGVLEARLHGVVGAGDEAVLPVLELSAGLRLR